MCLEFFCIPSPYFCIVYMHTFILYSVYLTVGIIDKFRFSVLKAGKSSLSNPPPPLLQISKDKNNVNIQDQPGNPRLPRLLIDTPARYPQFVDFTGKLNFWNKSRSTQLRISKPSKEHSCGSPKFPNQNFRQIGEGVSELWSDKQNNRHSDKQR